MHDYKTFMKFEKISKKIKIIGGGWYLLGSKLKMDHIKNEIDNLIREFAFIYNLIVC